MNTRPHIESPSPISVLSVAFNDDSSCFSVGLDSGFCIFNSEGCSLKTSRELGGGIALVQMMGMSNYLAMVGGGRQPKFPQNKIVLWDDSKGKQAMQITTMTAVRGVRLTKDRIVVVLQNSVRVYAFAKQPNLLAAYETADNLLGLCALSEKTLAFPGRTPGHLQLIDNATGAVSIIPAHSAALRALRMSPDGELLATASETGTLIRVFATSNCARLAELRRGVDPAKIFSLGFSPSGTMLACTSDKSTLHIFDVPHPKRPPRKATVAAAAANNAAHKNSPLNNPQHLYNGVPPLPGHSGGGGDGGNGDGTGKWGILGKIPLMPRMFSDVYSFAQCPFEAGDEPLVGGGAAPGLSDGATLGTTRPPKGVIGWVGEKCLLVLGAGKDPRWEKFALVEGDDGRRYCVREAWKRYVER